MTKAVREPVATDSLDAETLREGEEIDSAMARAVREAQERNRQLGLRNIYVRSGRIVAVLADGAVCDLGPAEPTSSAKKTA